MLTFLTTCLKYNNPHTVQASGPEKAASKQNVILKPGKILDSEEPFSHKLRQCFYRTPIGN